MKKNIRLICLLLSVAMLLGIFVACDQGGEETTVQETEAIQTPDTTAEETAGNDALTHFDLILDGETNVKIIRPMDLPSTDPAVASAVELRNAIRDLTGVSIPMADDFKKSTEEYDSTTLEILVGKTAHTEIAEATKALGYADYTVKLVGNKIVIYGFTEASLSTAVEALIKVY